MKVHKSYPSVILQSVCIYCVIVNVGSAKRWKKFVDSETPENEKFPGEWKNKTSLQKLCMMRALRPDRMTYAVM